jgi:hypothetical protein
MSELDLTHLWIYLQNFTVNTHYRSQGLRVLTDTRRGSTQIEVGEEGEGTPVKTVDEILVTVGEEAPAIPLDLR